MKKFRLSIHDSEHVLLRRWLIKKRKLANLSQRALAQRMGVIHSLVGKIESGERRLDAIEFVMYCEAINAEVLEGIEVIQTSLHPNGSNCVEFS